MKYHCTFLPYKQTAFFSNIVTDYIEQTQQLQAFYTYSINIQGIQKAIENKSKSYTNRSIIVSYFNEEYANKSITEKQKNNIKLLNNENCLLPILKLYEVNFIVLAGFLLLIPAFLVKQYSQKIINIHPALLPKYGGKGMYGMRVHETVFANKETETGITIHFVNNHYDEGEYILQKKVSIFRLFGCTVHTFFFYK